MPSAYLYHPVKFFLIIISIAFILGLITAYLSYQKGMDQYQLPLLLLGLCVPCITSIAMIYGSHNEELIQDFWDRLTLFKISPAYLAVILLLMPCIVFLATGLSLYFGYSVNQFSFASHLSVMERWAVLGMVIPLILAPIIEELGWRGYGIDSLRAHFNLFTATALFGFLWALWHVPFFFVKGYYHNQLWNLGIIYVINFFVSVFVVSILMNWVYYRTERSIPALVLFHSVLNLSSMTLKTDPFTKCIATALLCIMAIGVILYDKAFFFTDTILPKT